MRQARRRRMARRREVRALYWSRHGKHPWAIDLATEAVELWRPVAEHCQAAMARALAVRAVCLYVRGRTAEAERDVEQCLVCCDRVIGRAGATDLVAVASLLDHAGRAQEALTLAERLLADAQALAPAPMLVYGELLLRRGRAEEAVAALREGYAATAALSAPRMWASAMLFEALAATGRLEELADHAHRDLWLFAVNAWASVPGRRRYIHLLELLERHGVVSGRLPHFPTAIATQRRKLRRQQRRRWLLAVAVAVLTGRSRQMPDPPRATVSPDPWRVAALARVAQAEADVERYRESGDARSLSHAWGALAHARWQAGGQRSAALEAQRVAVTQTRQWAAENPEQARPALVMHLRRFAYFAGIIGLQHDAQQARTEAEDLERSTQ